MGILDFIFPKYCVSCKKLGEYICADCFSTISFNPYEICLVCNRGSIDGLTHPFCKTRYTIDGAFTSISYKGIVKKLVYQFKYKPFVSNLCNILVDLMYEGLIQKEMFMTCLRESTQAYLVPVPLYKSKLKRRGYNQAQLLALGLSKKLNIPTIDILMRVKNTRSQVGLERKKRIENVSGAFSIALNPSADGSKYPRSVFEKCHSERSRGISYNLMSVERDPSARPSDLVGMTNRTFQTVPNVFLVDDVLTTGSTLLEAANVLKRNGVKKVWGIALARD